MSRATRSLIFLLSAAAACCLGEPAFADPPVAVYVFPAGGQRGTSVDFHVGGLYLNPSCAFEVLGPGIRAPERLRRVETPWFEGPLLPLPDSQRQEDYPRAMAGKLTVAADAPLGTRPLRLWTSQGTTLPLKFVVGDLPEIVEKETDGEPVPVAVSPPLTVNGRIFPREDVDIWSVALKKGQSLTCVVDAARLGSPLQAHLEVRDPHGRRVAESDDSLRADPAVRFSADADGTYQVRIHDANFNGGPAFVYRLTLTTGPFVDRVFPLGGRRGETVSLELTGQNLPGKPVAVAIPRDAAPGYTHRLPVGNALSNSFALDVDDLREIREDESNPDPVKSNFLPVPAVGNGRIARPGEVDSWGFTARKGDAFEIELRAARLRSPLRGVLAIADSAGKELARAEAGANGSADPALRFVAPADGLFFVKVQDRFRSRGGPAFAYRLRVDRPAPDFDLRLAAASLTLPRGGQVPLRVAVQRRGGFNGPIALSVEGLPPGVSLPQAPILQPNQNTIDIPLKADATAPIRSATLTVRGTGWMQAVPIGSALVPVTRTAVLPAEPGDWPAGNVRLAVALPTPFKIVGDYALRLVPRGTVYTRHYRIERNGFAGPIAVSLADRQARHLQGVTGPTIVVSADKSEFDYPVTLPPWMDLGRTCRVCVMGEATVRDADGSEHSVTYSSTEQNNQIIAVIEPGPLSLEVDKGSLLAEPGKSVTLTVRVGRGKDLTGPATVELLVPGPIRGVRADPLTVPPGSGEGKLTVRFAADAKGPFALPLTVRATVRDKGRPVTAEARVEVLGR